MDPIVPTAHLTESLDEMIALVEAAGDRLDDRPFGPTTNSIGALAYHCSEVCEFWFGHVGLGRPSSRERDGEFSMALPVDELLAKLRATRTQVESDIATLAAGGATSAPENPSAEVRQFLIAGTSDDSLFVKVATELAQHVGHMEITLDSFSATGSGSGNGGGI